MLDDTGPSPAGEAAALSAAPMLASRIKVDRAVLAAAGRDIRGIVVRAGLVYGDGGGGTMRLLLELARREGGPFTVGDGWNVWSAVHRDDLGELYRLALENAPEGALYHAANDDRVSMREIAATGARAAGRFAPVRAIPVEEARAFAGGIADGLVAEKRISAARARDELGWTPRAPSIVEEIERGSYADGAATDGGATEEATLTMINAFGVPSSVTEQFVGGWLSDLDFMRRQDGFLSGTLYGAASEEARFRFVNVAHWRDEGAFKAAQAGIMARFRVENIDRLGEWKSADIQMNAATFRSFKRF